MSAFTFSIGSAVGAAVGVLAYKVFFEKEEINEVLFFPDSSLQTFDKYAFTQKPFKTAENLEIDSTSSLAKLLTYIRSAKQSVDVCLMIFTCQEFGSELLQLKRKGIKIRAIVDRSNIDNLGCQISRLRESGVRVVAKSQSYLMHHKFAVIDNRIVVNGSFNWTGSAVFGNNENVIVTDNKKIVSAFVEEFNKLWNVHT